MGKRGHRRNWSKYWWATRRQFLKLGPKRTCTDCGFLAYGDQEADAIDRVRLSAHGSFGGPPGLPEKWGCARKLWFAELHYVEPDWAAVFEETDQNRRGCRGFFRQSPGRTPAEHFELEKESIAFRRKLWLGVLPLLYGSVGAAIGWWFSRR
jgi:hypothetical protein